MAVQEGLRYIALTDHDTTAGVVHLQNALPDSIQLISGVEISSRWNRSNIHIVGLGFDLDHTEMVELLASQTEKRVERNRQIALKLQKLLRVEEDMLALAQAQAGEGQLCRPHFAQAVVQLGFCNSTNEVFKRWLGNGKPAAIGIEWPNISEVVSIIKRAGGKAVIAHPLQYGMTRTKLNALMADFADAGGDAIEIATPDIKVDQARSLLDRAAKLGLLASGGSDFHSVEWGGKKLGAYTPLPEDDLSIVTQLGLKPYEPVFPDS